MAQLFTFTLLDDQLEIISDFIIPDSDDIEGARLQAEKYLHEHGIPVGTLEIDDAKTLLPVHEPIDILL